jgi:hypothetical protein
MWRFIRLVLVGAAVMIVTLISVAYTDARHEKYEAEQLLIVLTRINVGSSTENDATNATNAFNGYADRQMNFNRQNVVSDVEFTFRNRVIAFLHLAPAKFVYLGLEFRNGVVVSKSFNFYQEPRSGAIVQEVMAAHGSDPMKISTRQIHLIDYGHNRHVIEVRDDTSVPLARRQLDWHIDLSCMTEIMTCKDPHRILPGISQQ